MRIRQTPGYRDRKPTASKTQTESFKPFYSSERVTTPASGYLIIRHACTHEEAHAIGSADVTALMEYYTHRPCSICMQTVVCNVCGKEVTRSDAKSLRIAISRMTKQPHTTDLQPEEFASTELWVCAAHAYVMFRHMQHTVSDLKAQYAPVPAETK